MRNVIGRNRKSPSNEDFYIQEYLKRNPKAEKKDGYDISVVVSKNGTKGHGLLSEDINRSHDKNQLPQPYIHT